MERAFKEKAIAYKLLLTGVLLILLYDLHSQPIPFAPDTLQYDRALVKVFSKCKSKVFYRVEQIEDSLIDYVNKAERSKCIANPGQAYNDRDVKYDFFCDARLVFYALGKWCKLRCIVLEVDFNSYRCYLIKYEKEHVFGVAIIDIPVGTNSLKKLKRAFRKGKYMYKPQSYRAR
jgi:hypothetical protein